ncbi:MAG: biotin/lipoyl-binding protein [Prolixibacteraceae bacterium]|nr:biotin/lipoyl-binding protein [Prolixibacteraceae bacterium]
MKTVELSKILIANRGEIALRIIRSARSMGISTVAIYSHGEENCQHVLAADEAVTLGDGSLHDTYLNIPKIIGIALRTGSKAIHPGYGFLSEQAAFAEACVQNNLVFIGPSADVLKKMGNKLTAKSVAVKAGVPVLENVIIADIDQLTDPGKFDYPLLIKAAHGGGGKGMQIVNKPDALKSAVIAASRAAQNYFGNGEVFLETYLEEARHIEVQILGDRHGNLVHLFERDCTVQRNHQKIVEEAPAQGLDATIRSKLHAAALALGKAVGYENAGTVEFLLDTQGRFYFLEMNPRIQVEHPVTEQITGVDLVREQINIAAGKAISFQQDDLQIKGHAIEMRVYQEDPMKDFSPSTKKVEQFRLPQSDFLRIETDLSDDLSASTQFDPLLMKLIVTATNRDEALTLLENTLKETYIAGPATNLDYLKVLLQHPAFRFNQLSTRFLEKEHQTLITTVLNQRQKHYSPFITAAKMLQHAHQTAKPSLWETIGNWGLSASMTIEIDGTESPVEWKKQSASYQLLLGGQLHTVQILAQSEKQIQLAIDGRMHVLHQFSFKSGQTRWGVDGFIFEPFCNGLLNDYPDADYSQYQNNETDTNCIISHLHGKIETINITINQTVNKGDLLMTINAMKSENAVKAPRKAKIKQINVVVGDQVSDGTALVLLEEIAL